MDGKALKRRFFQFRLSSLFWLMLCICVGIGAYRQGYKSGHSDRANGRKEVGSTYNVVHSVLDIVPMTRTQTGVTADLDGLVRDLTADVLPETWDTRGGEASIAKFSTNLSLVVSHDSDGQQRVAEYLSRLRKKRKSPLAVASAPNSSSPTP